MCCLNGVDKQETVLELWTKNIPQHCVWEVSKWSSHMGLHMYGTCELPANNTTLGKAPPDLAACFGDWNQPKRTWTLPKGLQFSCFQMWLGPCDSAGWPRLTKFTALHPFPTWGPMGVMLATFIQHFAVPWGWAQSQDWILLYRTAHGWCNYRVASQSLLTHTRLQWTDFGQFWIRCSKL